MANARNRGSQARNVSRNIWLSSAEDKALLERVGTRSVSAWLRDLALGQAPQPARAPRRNKIGVVADVMAPVTRAVAKIGNNLNQIARQVNSNALAGRTIDIVQVRVSLTAIRTELRQIREEVERACEDLSSRQG
jgi:predicted amino acid-binding ACT domain protein